ncbi:hypothetical protein G7Z17_g1004 [Cylindrodendrum hubeiense]|uniref:Uncharacterized protein n=1 Tax=Cylindrodendrum hubeiense TaxID=595255 RepID=A0A9P5LCV9_9HYPO|nr:hypothetical protein G7Z17_g1004 [Cylindrodendrum hubeiense]
MLPPFKHASKLAGTRVLVIGGTTGVGLAVAEACVDSGAASVIISSSNIDRINSAVSQLRSSFPDTNCQIIGFPCDLKHESSLESNIAALFEASTPNGTKLDHVVVTAGDRPVPRPLNEINFNYIKDAGMIRLFAPLLVAKHAAMHLVPGPASSIMFTSGISAYRPYPNWNAIGAFVSSLEGMTRSLAVELKPTRVNLICPGPVDTGLMSHFYPDPETRKVALEALSERSLTGAVGKAQDVAESYLYCMKDQNLSGSIIRTDGGILLV